MLVMGNAPIHPPSFELEELNFIKASSSIQHHSTTPVHQSADRFEH